MANGEAAAPVAAASRGVWLGGDEQAPVTTARNSIGTAARL
jgi:hypothetical protein